MMNTMLRTTALTPSRFGMSACGHASFGAEAGLGTSTAVERPWVKSAQIRAARAADVAVLDVTVVRDAEGFDIPADRTDAPTYFPGIPAWSPPSC